MYGGLSSVLYEKAAIRSPKRGKNRNLKKQFAVFYHKNSFIPNSLFLIIFHEGSLWSICTSWIPYGLVQNMKTLMLVSGWIENKGKIGEKIWREWKRNLWLSEKKKMEGKEEFLCSECDDKMINVGLFFSLLSSIILFGKEKHLIE